MGEHFNDGMAQSSPAKPGCRSMPLALAKKRGNTVCISSFFNAVWREKTRRDVCKDFISGY
jgi:hypothetical protein